MQYLFLQIRCTLIINFSKYPMYMMNIEKRRNNVYLPESQTISACSCCVALSCNILPAKYNIYFWTSRLRISRAYGDVIMLVKGFCPVPVAFGQGGIFIVPHLPGPQFCELISHLTFLTKSQRFIYGLYLNIQGVVQIMFFFL